MAVATQAVADGLLQGRGRHLDVEIRHVGNQIDVAFVDADRLDRLVRRAVEPCR